MKNHMILDICIHVHACINVHVCASAHTHISIWQNSTFIFDKKKSQQTGIRRECPKPDRTYRKNLQLISHLE